MSAIFLIVDGEVENRLELSFDDLEQFSEAEHIRDVSRFHPTRHGDGVTLESILSRAGVKDSAGYLTLHATHDDFAASVPLEAVRGEGIVVYQVDGGTLPVEKGGPLRFLIRNAAACKTDELDECANVKHVDRIELTPGRGRDTRPGDEEEHERLHAAEE